MRDVGYAVAGSTVGSVDKEVMLDGSTMLGGGGRIGLSSTGVHSSGFSLVRKVFNLSEKNVNLYVEELGATLGETLLTPTKIYVKPVLSVLKNHTVRAISHVTGGGFYENIPRMMKDGLTAKIELASFPKLPIFSLLQQQGKIPERDMYNTFNMGVGMCMAVPKEEADAVLADPKASGAAAYRIGGVVGVEEGVALF